jgi:anti-anti-sigma factor
MGDISHSGGAMTVGPGGCSESFCTIYVEGPLRLPVNRDLHRSVRTLLRQGERDIVLDLAAVTRIDAAGVGELVRAYNMTNAAAGYLRVVHTNRWVREILNRVGLYELLSAGRDAEYAAVNG